MITKQDYDKLIARYSMLEKEMVRLQERKRQAEEEIRAAEDSISAMTEGRSRDSDDYVERLVLKLEKELETRIEVIRNKVSEFERVIQDFKILEDRDAG